MCVVVFQYDFLYKIWEIPQQCKGRFVGITLNISSNKMSHFSNVLAILKVSLYFGLIICVSISDVLKIEIRIYITAFGKQAGIILVNNIIMTLGIRICCFSKTASGVWISLFLRLAKIIILLLNMGLSIIRI